MSRLLPIERLPAAERMVIERIILQRQALGLSYGDLGRLLSLRPKDWWRFEKGVVRLRVDAVPRIAVALRTSVAALYGECPPALPMTQPQLVAAPRKRGRPRKVVATPATPTEIREAA